MICAHMLGNKQREINNEVNDQTSRGRNIPPSCQEPFFSMSGPVENVGDFESAKTQEPDQIIYFFEFADHL